jgi:two-component system response regulator YesN
MLKVLLIDDEKWIVKSLKSLVDWNSLGYEIIAEAFNGVEGYEKIKQLSPDLVFTDIRMPGIDGLELIRKSNELNRDISFIVTSGYKEFEYARKAIQYGALSYCLKPFDEAEIIEVLDQFSKKQQRLRAILQMELLNMLQESEGYSSQLLLETMSKLGFNWDEKIGAGAVVVVGTTELEISVGVPYISLQIGRSMKAYILRGDYITVLSDSLSHCPPEGISGIGIGNCEYDPTSLIHSIGEASVAANRFFITGNKGIWNARFPSCNLDEIKEILWRLNQTRNLGLVNDLTEKIASLIAEGTFTIKNAVSLHNMVLFHVYNLEEEQLLSYQQLYNRFSHVNEMIAYLRSLLLNHYSRSFEASPKIIPPTTFGKIVAYIDEHFNEDLSLQMISEKLMLNPSYVSQLFRKEASETFLQYLTKKRIANACRLLNETSFSIHEISENSGYLDYFHFAKTFKKCMGLTASQYREAHRK